MLELSAESCLVGRDVFAKGSYLEELREPDPAAGAAGTGHHRGDPRGADRSALMLETRERPLPASWEEQRERFG
jgi:hypothetical protein